ncbi:AbrB/MazE/SpoVT family DNA-binding domain-containing protein [Aneurinibacillus sp. UBA3580]|jgi:putative addiction module antidote|uniref:AbrB/MazE/SpoVT family DNA-binding domain-containing protein n=1 Tax=Aneurinibacillus sp. UBA3580 TaxID=1946041 RepID=UPI00257C4550|nr:AbrB/MazE/SpoVT family DNA-binding domain-containing protein [Aneurinibacillus sp. UBA3580]
MSVIEMEVRKPIRRKVTRYGNSLGITIPSEIVQQSNISIGDEFEWFITENGDVMGKRVRKSEVREEVLDIFADILEEDAELLWALRDK